MKNKKVLALIGVGVLLVGVFGITYGIRSHQLREEDKKPSMNTEYVEEIDDYKIESFKAVLGDKEYISLDQIKDVDAGSVLKCHVKLASGEEKDVEGYVTFGEHEDITYNGSLVKITLVKNETPQVEDPAEVPEEVNVEEEK